MIVLNLVELSTSRHTATAFSAAIFFVALILFVWFRLIPLRHNRDILTNDFVQMYLTGKAVAAGVPVYEPLPDLAARFDPRLNDDNHPSAYPPAFALLGAFVSRSAYEKSFMLWGDFEILCFVATVLLLFQRFREVGPGIFIIATLMLMWWPLYVDLFQGQVMMLALLLLTGSWLLLRTRHEFCAGVLLGVLFSLKLYGLPILIFLLIIKKGWPVLAALLTFIVINLVAIYVVGLDQALFYAQRVVPSIARIYHGHPLNFSLFALFGPIAAFLVFTVVMFLATRSDLDVGFMLSLVIASVLSPVAWIHYLVTLLPAACLLVDRNRKEPLRLLPLVILAMVVAPDAEIYKMFGVRWWPLTLVFGLLIYLGLASHGRKAVAAVQRV